MSETVLLTGATGLVGMEVLVRLLERTDAEVIALVRARDRQHAEQRMRTVLAQLYDCPSAAVTSRIRALPAELCHAHLGLSAAVRRELGATVDSVIHCAASIAFDLPLDRARSINTVGTQNVLQLACELRYLRRIVHVSTAYVAGRHRGVFHEDDLDLKQSFRNSYEQSKFETELILAESQLPLVIARPSIIMGDQQTGWTSAFNVLYWPMRAFARGLLEEVPVDPDGIVDVVPVDYVADAIVYLLAHAEVNGTVNLVAGRHAITNAQLIEFGSKAVGREPPRLTADAVLIDQARTYLPYFDVASTFDDRRARQVLSPSGIEAGKLSDYLPAIVAYALRANWGKTPLTRQAAQLVSVV